MDSNTKQIETIKARQKRLMHRDNLKKFGFGSREAFADALGAGVSSVRQYATGRTIVPDEYKQKFCDLLGITLDYLLTGSGRTRANENSAPQQQIHKISSDKILIPVYDVVVSAGHGKTAFEPQIIDNWEMPRAFFKSMSSTAGRNKAFLPVEGDSNAPDYNDGDFVLIDTSLTMPVKGKMFVILIGDMLVLKEIHPDGANVSLVSRNPAYKPLKKRYDEVHIVAQVVKKLVDV